LVDDPAAQCTGLRMRAGHPFLATVANTPPKDFANATSPPSPADNRHADDLKAFLEGDEMAPRPKENQGSSHA
jgi:hypothetical protein